MMLMPAQERPYDRIKVKFTDGQYFVHEIEPTFDPSKHSVQTAHYIEYARELLGIGSSVETEYVRPLAEGEDESED